MKKSRFVRNFLTAVLILIFACVIYGIIGYRQDKKEEAMVLQGIAERTGLEPDWLAIREYVYCELLKPSTPIEEVETALALIGDYWMPDSGVPRIPGSSFDRHIEFFDAATSYNLTPLSILYDENGQVKSSGAGEFNHGPRASCEKERAVNARRTLTP